MSAKAKSVGKADIRRLMKDSKSKISSPLAKYNSSGQLTCVLCATVVKNELQWPAHVNGKVHKVNAAKLKSGEDPWTKVQAVKRKSESGGGSFALSGVATAPALVGVNGLPDDFFEGSSAAKIPKLSKGAKSVTRPYEKSREPSIPKLGDRPPPKPQGILKNKSECKTIVQPRDFSAPAAIESDFKLQELSPKKNSPAHDPPEKDSGPSNSQLKNEDDKLGKSAEIPDGFFDDPVADAKAHQKEYVDPMDAQWELFQKEIKMETYKSEAIEEEEDDVMIFERELSEVDEQIAGWAKVEALHIKKVAAFVKTEIKEEPMDATNESEVVKVKEEESDEEDSSEEDEDFDELLDWRSKGT